MNPGFVFYRYVHVAVCEALEAQRSQRQVRLGSGRIAEGVQLSTVS